MHSAGGPLAPDEDDDDVDTRVASFDPQYWPVTAGSADRRLDRRAGAAVADVRSALEAYGQEASEEVREAVAGPLASAGPLVRWSGAQVAAWAVLATSPATAACLRRAHIDGRAAALLTEVDLRELGVRPVAARKHLLAGLAALASPPPPPSLMQQMLPGLLFSGWSMFRGANASKMFFYCSAYFILGMIIALLGPTLLAFADEFHTSAQSLNFVFFFRGFGWVVSSIGSGWLFDHLPGHPLMFGAVSLMAATTVVVPFAARVSKWLWGAVFFFIGVAGAAIDVGDNTMIAWIYGDRLGPFIQLIHFWFGIGAFLSPLIVAAVLKMSGGMVSWAYWFFALICLPILLLALLTRSPPRRLPVVDEDEEEEEAGADGDGEEARAASGEPCDSIELRPLVAPSPPDPRHFTSPPPQPPPSAACTPMPDAERAELYPQVDGRYGPELLDADALAALHDVQAAIDAQRAAREAALAEARRQPPVPKPMVALLGTLLFFYCGTEVGFGSWVYSYAVNRGLADELTAAYINSVFWGAITAGRLLGVLIASRVPPPWLMLCDMLGCVSMTALLIVFMNSSVALWVLTGLFGLAMGSIFASAFSFPGWLGLRITARDTMVLVIGVALGEMGVPGFLGLMFELFGYYMLPWCICALTIMQLTLLLVLWRIAPRRFDKVAAAAAAAAAATGATGGAAATERAEVGDFEQPPPDCADGSDSGDSDESDAPVKAPTAAAAEHADGPHKPPPV